MRTSQGGKEGKDNVILMIVAAERKRLTNQNGTDPIFSISPHRTP